MGIKEHKYSGYLTLLIRLLIGGVLVVSGVSKLPMQSGFVGVVQSFGVLPAWMATAYGLVLPWLELLLGCYFILGILVKPGAVVTVLISISFLVANIKVIINSESFCPDCFGELFPLTAVQALSIDVLIIVAAIILFLLAGDREILSFDTWFARKFGGIKS